MIAATSHLPPLEQAGGRELSVSLLSGDKYWYQTLFCVYSLQLHSDYCISPVIFDDGSITEIIVANIKRVIPWAQFSRSSEIEELLDRQLPSSRFPSLRARRLDFPLLRKICDVRLGRENWVLFLDSDMLFFRRPTMLLNWMAAPDEPCHLVDVQRAYGYSAELMKALSGHEELDRVNTGICGLHGGTIDWERLEYWCREMLEREGPSYLQEQALTALMLSGQGCLRLPEPDYRVMPSPSEGRRPAAALHHYVAHSKRSYFQYGWRRVLADTGKEIAA